MHQFDSLDDFAKDLLNFFDSIGGHFNNQRVRSRRESDGIRLEVDMPGYKKEAVSLTTDKGVLRISGVRDGSLEFSRQYALPSDIDPNSAKARLEDGVLYITLLKAKNDSGVKINID